MDHHLTERAKEVKTGLSLQSTPLMIFKRGLLMYGSDDMQYLVLILCYVEKDN